MSGTPRPGLIGADVELEFSEGELGEMDAELVGKDREGTRRRRRSMVRVPVDEVHREASGPTHDNRSELDSLVEQAFSGETKEGSVHLQRGELQKGIEPFTPATLATPTPAEKPRPPKPPLAAVSALLRAATAPAAVSAPPAKDDEAPKTPPPDRDNVKALLIAVVPEVPVEVEPDSPGQTATADEAELDSDELEETAKGHEEATTPPPRTMSVTQPMPVYPPGSAAAPPPVPSAPPPVPSAPPPAPAAAAAPPPAPAAAAAPPPAPAAAAAPPPAPAAAAAPPPAPAAAAAPPPPPATAAAPPPPPAPTAAPPPPPAPSAMAAEARPRPRRRRREKQWFEEVFDDDFLRTLPRRTSEQLEHEVDFVAAAITRRSDESLLDLGCGPGQHAIELTRRGYSVTGFDMSLPLLIRAAESARRLGVSVNFVHGDMREMTFDGEFDGAYALGATFGYFDDDANRLLLSSIAKALKPGGRLLLDLPNRDYLVRELPTRVWWEGDGCMVLEEVDFNYFASRLSVQRTVVFEDGRQLDQEISIRAYSLHEIGKLLHHCGFKVIEVSGQIAMRGHFFGADSRSLLVIAEKRPASP